jgi:hypothetical protein
MDRWIDHGRAVLAGCLIVAAAIIALGVFAVLQPHQLLDQPRPAQSHLRNALTAARTLYTDSGTYREATPRALSTTEPSLHFGSPQQADKSMVGVAATDQTIYFVTREPHGSQRWFCLLEDDTKSSPGTTTYGLGPTLDSVAPARCRQPSW